MNNQYYKYIVYKLLELKQRGYFSHIELHGGFIDPQLDILLHSFALAAEDMEQIVESSKKDIKINLMRLHGGFLFRPMVSKIIMIPDVNFESPIVFVKKGSVFNVYEKENTYVYRTSYDHTLFPIQSIISSTEYASDLNIKNEFGDYFIALKFKFIPTFNFGMTEQKSIRILMYHENIVALSELMLSMFKSNLCIFFQDGSSLVKIGKVVRPEIIDLEDQNDMPKYILPILNYNHFSQVYYQIDLVFDIDISKISNLEELSIYININNFVKIKNFAIYNFLFLTNLDSIQSNMFKMENSLKLRTYIDYLTRDILKIYSIKNLYAFDIEKAKKYSVQNFICYAYDKQCPTLEQVYWSHAVEYGPSENKDYICLDTLSHNIELLEDIKDKLQYFYIADAYQIINRRINVEDIICVTDNKILFKKLILGPTFSREVILDNTNVLDNLFSVYNIDIVHTKNKRGVLLNILNCFAYIFGNYVTFDKVIYNIEIEYEFVESVVNNQYTSNMMLYKIKITIDDENAVKYDFYAALSKMIIGLFGITVDVRVVFTNLQQTNIIYNEYSSD